MAKQWVTHHIYHLYLSYHCHPSTSISIISSPHFRPQSYRGALPGYTVLRSLEAPQRIVSWWGRRFTAKWKSSVNTFWVNMGVSWKLGTPKSSVLLGIPNINHPAIGVPPWRAGNPHIVPNSSKEFKLNKNLTNWKNPILHSWKSREVAWVSNQLLWHLQQKWRNAHLRAQFDKKMSMMILGQPCKHIITIILLITLSQGIFFTKYGDIIASSLWDSNMMMIKWLKLIKFNILILYNPYIWWLIP